MLLFFTPNPCIERTLHVPDFAAHSSFRVESAQIRVTAGGKGINAARVAKSMGAEVVSLAPVGIHQRAQFQSFFENDGIRAEWIEVAAATRTALNIVHAGGVTEIIEAGNPLSLDDGAQIIERFVALLPRCDLVIIGGSYPTALPDDVAAWERHSALLCALTHRAGKRVFYDGNDAAWKRTVLGNAPPWAVKPNLKEASFLLDRAIETRDEERAAVRELMRRGIKVVLLSCGARGLWLGYGGQIEWLAAPSIEEVSPVGSGDSLVGAFVAQWSATGDIGQAAQWGVSAGAANAAQLEAARVTRADVEPLVEKVRREIVELSLVET